MSEPLQPAKVNTAVAVSRSAGTVRRAGASARVDAGALCMFSVTALFTPCGQPRLRTEILEPLSSSLPSWLAPGRRTALSSLATAARGRA